MNRPSFQHQGHPVSFFLASAYAGGGSVGFRQRQTREADSHLGFAGSYPVQFGRNRANTVFDLSTEGFALRDG
jgi:hypothetical protein